MQGVPDLSITFISVDLLGPPEVNVTNNYNVEANVCDSEIASELTQQFDKYTCICERCFHYPRVPDIID